MLKGNPFRSVLKRALAILISLIFGLIIFVQDVHAKTTVTVSLNYTQKGPTSPTELETFLDGIISEQLEKHYIPGATVSIVKDGQLFFAKGYGIANVKTGQPVIADKTLFRIGSVTKLFTWTAVMQLVEQGKLDLNTDINLYLKDLHIPDTYLEPITLAHLLTHTPGFEDRSMRLFVFRSEDLIPLKEYLFRELPERVYPPGEISAYSNYGTALGGYLVESVSGIPYNQYVKKNILIPLEMNNSFLESVPPPEFSTNMAMGHMGTKDNYQILEEYIVCSPIGGVSATSTDMAHFMIAHLQNGLYKNTRILNETTAQEMHRQHFTNDSRIRGITYGFMELERNNQWIIWHTGSSMTFFSLCMLLPEWNVGLFVSYNSDGGVKARTELRQAFLDHYYPFDHPTPQSMKNVQTWIEFFTGSYVSSRRAFTSYEKFLSTLMGQKEVIANPDGTLQFHDTRYVEVEPLVFKGLNQQGTLIFREDDQGCITTMFSDNFPYEGYHKLKWYEAPSFHLHVFGMCIGIFLLSLIGRLIAAILHRQESKTGVVRLPRLARWLGVGVCGLYLLPFVLIPLVVLIRTLRNPDRSMFVAIGSVDQLISMLAILILPAVLTIAMVSFTVLIWKNKKGSVWGRIRYTLVTLAAVIFVWWLNYWNLL